MFPNAVMMKPQTWNDILAVMIAVRDRHGWREVERLKAAPLKPAVAVVAAKLPNRSPLAHHAPTGSEGGREGETEAEGRPGRGEEGPGKKAEGRPSGRRAGPQEGVQVKVRNL